VGIKGFQFGIGAGNGVVYVSDEAGCGPYVTLYDTLGNCHGSIHQS
jgi:hypothetical protein